MAAEAGVALGVPFIWPETGRRAIEGGGLVAAGIGLMDFNGETFSRLDTAPRGAEPEGAELGEGVDMSGRQDGYRKHAAWWFPSGRRRRLGDRRRMTGCELGRVGRKANRPAGPV
jgi:hypothetical protein